MNTIVSFLYVSAKKFDPPPPIPKPFLRPWCGSSFYYFITCRKPRLDLKDRTDRVDKRRKCVASSSEERVYDLDRANTPKVKRNETSVESMHTLSGRSQRLSPRL